MTTGLTRKTSARALAAACVVIAAAAPLGLGATAQAQAQADAGVARAVPPGDAGAARSAPPGDAGAPKAAQTPKSTVTVRIQGLRNDTGIIFVALFDSERGFDGKKHAAGGQARPSGGSAVVVFQNVAPGTYAFSFIHDENENKKLDTNFLGIPTEGFGFSRDAMGTFGPPSFEATAMTVLAGAVTVRMRAKYFF